MESLFFNNSFVSVPVKSLEIFLGDVLVIGLNLFLQIL